MTSLLTTQEQTKTKKYIGNRQAHVSAPSLLGRTKNVGYGEAVESFLESREANGNTKHSLKTVASKLRKFGSWLDDSGLGLPDVREEVLDKYMIYRKVMDGVGEIARHSDVIQIKALTKHCARRNYVRKNWLAEYKNPGHEEPYVKMPSADEVLKLFTGVEDKCRPDKNPCRRHRNRESQGFFTSRDQAILAVATDAALRPAEYFALTPADYDRAHRQLIIRTSKVGKPRYVPISEHTVRFLDAWLKHRPDEGIMREMDDWHGEDEKGEPLRPTLFVTDGGTQISVQSWSRQFHHYCEWAGVEEVTPYGLRHFAITKIAQKDPLAAQEIAGHSSLNTTMMYVHKDADYNRAAHSNADPLGQVMALAAPQKPKRRSLIKR